MEVYNDDITFLVGRPPPYAARSMTVSEIQCRSIITCSGLSAADFTANPYRGCAHACKYCYASYMTKYIEAAEPWGEFVDVKHWQPLTRPEKYCGSRIVIGTVTDPYQPVEQQYRRTRALLEQLRGSGAEVSITTKSDLVLRDIDILKELGASVNMSINTLNEEFRQEMDKAPPIANRFDALERLHAEGISTHCFIAPIFPGTDVGRIILRAKDICDEIWLDALNLRCGNRPVIMSWIREKYPRLYPTYCGIYAHGSREYWVSLTRQIGEFCAKNGIDHICGGKGIRGAHSGSSQASVVNFFYQQE